MQKIDMLRQVPEMAVRVVCGAKVKKISSNHTREIDFQGEKFTCDEEVFVQALKVAKVLSIDNSVVSTMNDVLRLRHKAEDVFVEMITIGKNNIPQVLFVPAGEQMASAFVRARIPADFLTDRRRAIAHYTDRLDISKALRYQILWIQLSVNPVLEMIAVRAKASGIKIVYDVDDKFDAIPPENPASALYVKQKQEDVWRMIELADAVTVSTNDLLRHISKRNPNTVVVPNEIPASIWPRAKAPPTDHIKILWAGSPTHKKDLEVVAPALRNVLERHAGKVRFTCFGEQVPAALAPVSKYVDTIGFVQFTEYGDALAGVGAHIAIAPLEKNSFNDGKSAIKFLEYSACGYPSLLSPVGEYLEIPEVSGRIHVPDSEWEQALEFAIGDPEYMAALGQKSKAWVLENRCVMKSGARRWLDVISELVKNENV